MIEARAGRARSPAGRAAARARALQGRPRLARGAPRRRPPSGAQRRGEDVAGARHLERDAAGPRRARARAAAPRAGGRAASPTRSPARARSPSSRCSGPAARSGFESTRDGRRAGSASRASAVERLVARHDLENEEALAHVEHRLRRMGVIARARGGRIRARRRRRDRRASCSSSIPARRSRLRGRMPVAVVKLGSSIVAEDGGELRLSRRSPAICEEVAALHRAGVDVVVVTSGAIARGVHMLELPVRPSAIEDLQAASAVGQGRLYRSYDELLRERGRPARAGAAHVLRHERAHALPQRPPHAAQAARLADRAGDQRERHDDDRRDLLRRQRLPRRAGRGPGRRRAARAAHRHRRPLHRRPARGPGARARARGRRRRDARRRSTIGALGVAAGLGRHALEGRGGRDGHRGRHPGRDRLRAASPACSARAWPAEAAGTRFAAAPVRHSTSSSGCKYAKPTRGTVDRRRGRGAGAARGRHVAAAGRDRRRARRIRRRRGRRGRRPRRRRGIGKGICQLLRRRAAAGHGHAVRPRCARCSRARPRRPCTATTSCSTTPRPSRPWPRSRPPPSVTDVCLRRQGAPRGAWRALDSGGQGRARCTRSPPRWRRARRRSSRPTRATWRPAARPGSPPR